MEDTDKKGIVPRIVSTVFSKVHEADSSIEFSIQMSCIEIYLERIRDLLDPTKQNLQIRQSRSKGLYIDGVTKEAVASADHMMAVLTHAQENRASAATGMNKVSCVQETVDFRTCKEYENMKIQLTL